MDEDDDENVVDLPLCKYDLSCYRKNPEHFKQFSHSNQLIKKSSSLLSNDPLYNSDLGSHSKIDLHSNDPSSTPKRKLDQLFDQNDPSPLSPLDPSHSESHKKLKEDFQEKDD